MKIRALLVILLTLACAGAYAQDGGVKGKVVSRDGRVALSNVKVVVEPLGVTVMTDNHGNFNIDQLPKGEYQLKFEAPEFENLDLALYRTRLGSAHVMGGCAMGEDAQQAVVDSLGRHHHLANLSIHDGSLFPTSIGANPQLSIYGLTAKLATLLAERLKSPS